MSRAVHLLVHAGAPSTKHADNTYREQARSLANFNPQVVQHVTPEPNGRLQEQPLLTLSSSAVHDGPDNSNFYEDDTQKAFTALESQLLATRVLSDEQPAQHTELHIRQPAQPVVTSPQAFITPSNDSSLATLPTHSSYLVSPVFNRASRQLVRDPGSTPSPVFPLTGQRHVDPVSAKNVPPRGPELQSSDSRRASSELPTTYELTDVTTENSRPLVLDSPAITSDHQTAPGAGTVQSGQISSDGIVNAQTSDAPAESPINVEGRGFEHDEMVVDKAAVVVRDPTSSPVSHHPESGTTSNAALVQEPATDIASLPTVIYAPVPPVGVKPASTWITKHLQFLADHEIGQHYRPVSVARELQPDERGAWTIEASQWPIEIQVSFWKYLEQSIGAGLAGWGVWCTRETESDTSLGRVRVFCWGESVMHVYLLLYVASHSKVRRRGLQWIDAEEKVVVQMP